MKTVTLVQPMTNTTVTDYERKTELQQYLVQLSLRHELVSGLLEEALETRRKTKTRGRFPRTLTRLIANEYYFRNAVNRVRYELEALEHGL
jgi:hypothetical protein